MMKKCNPSNGQNNQLVCGEFFFQRAKFSSKFGDFFKKKKEYCNKIGLYSMLASPVW